MAAAVSAHCLSLGPFFSISRTTSNFPQIIAFAVPLHQGASRNSSFSTLRSPQYSQKSFRTAFKLSATNPKGLSLQSSIKMDENEKQYIGDKSTNLTEQNDNMKALYMAYKEALLNGDEKSASEIEESICILEKELNKLSSKSTYLISEIASAKDKLLRLNADFENFRKRSDKDRHTFTSDRRAEVVERLLPIVDNFERVKQKFKPETERERKIDASYQGIYRQFVEIMRSMRVSVVVTVGRPFDPSIHEAISREESQQFKPGIVTQELCRGFLLDDRVLRLASVKVSTGPGTEKISSAPTKSIDQSGEASKYFEDSTIMSPSS